MTKYALKEVTLIFVLGAAVTAVTGWAFGWWALAPGLLTAALLAFFRDPPRSIPRDPRVLLAPADGVVVEVETEGRLWVAIFLSVFNVHINRAPCAGRVTGVTYTPGRFLNALNAESMKVNERNTVAFDPEGPLPGPIEVTQISGALARRIACGARSGDAVTQGERFGMIKLGSRTTLEAPQDPRWEVLVKPGQPVRAGKTVLARLRAD